MKKILKNLFLNLRTIDQTKVAFVFLFILLIILGKISLAQTSLTTDTVFSPTTIEPILPTVNTTKTEDPIPVTVTPTINTVQEQTTTPIDENIILKTETTGEIIEPTTKIVPIETTNTVIDSQISPSKIDGTIKTKNVPIQPQTTEVKIQTTSNTYEALQNTVENTKIELKKIIDQNIKEAISEKTTTSPAVIESIREGMVSNIDNTLTNTKSITPEKINELSKNIQTELGKINEAKTNIEAQTTNYSQAVEQTFETMSMNIEEQVKTLKEQGGDLLYKDTNNDGISDYDSTYVYNIDPIKPTPKTVYEGREITAGEKITLGFDPKETTLVKISPEEPVASDIKPTSFYKVENIKLTSDKKITITGKFLPNSFVTIYVYSTPIIVTVKTDINGEWEYTLDKELDDGEHTIYTATVNNTGKIIAKSPAFTFIKTAEAATLETISPIQTQTEDTRPGIFSGNNLYTITGLFILIIFSTLIIVGINTRKNIPPIS